MKKILSSLALVGALAAGPAAWAADPFTDAMQAAYAPYREALFRTNSRAADESARAMERTRAAWVEIVERFATRPPAPYDRDPSFADTLAKVARVFDDAALQIGRGQLAEAHETLESARDMTAALRQRNQVVVYSDHMNAYHSEMEHLLIGSEKMLAGPQGASQVLARTGALDYLVRRLRSEAPAALRATPGFDARLREVEASVGALMGAALGTDTAAIRAAIKGLKRPYSRLFLDFG